MRWFLPLVLVLASPFPAPASPAPAPWFEESVLWAKQDEGVARYHVFGLVRSVRGTLLAFAEARLKRGDHDPHHLVVRRSRDGGRTWERNIIVERADGAFWAAQGRTGKLECWTNCGPVVEEQGGRIFFFYALNEGSRDQKFTRVFYRCSDDDGLTWQGGGRVEVTHLLADNPHGWTFHMPGPGHGIQLRHQQGQQASRNGRLVLPFWHRRALPDTPRRYGVSLLVSDDRGRTWRRAGDAGVQHGMNESRVVELADGRLLLNARGGAGERDGQPFSTLGQRVWTSSDDAGESFQPPIVRTEFDYQRNGCDSSLIRYDPTGRERGNILLFSHPDHPTQRARMVVSVSEDAGRTWAHHRQLHDGPSGYSDLVVLPDGTIGLLHGKGDEVAFARFTLAWLRSGPPPTPPASR
jgi:hypothetical protein